MPRTTKTTGTKKTTRRIKIAGLPIEGASPATAITDLANTKVETNSRLKAEKQAMKIYQGTIEADRVYRKRMPEFKNCVAFAWMIVNGQTVTYANSYGQTEDGTAPRSSWKPEDYTHPLNEKTFAKKVETYAEVEDREEWPTWIKPAFHPTEKPTKKSRRSK